MSFLPGEWDGYTGEQVEAIATLALVVPLADITPSVYGDMSEELLRCKYAGSWVGAGFRDPGRVSDWITAGVQSARCAAIYERMGYQPGDRWIEMSPAEYVAPLGVFIAGQGYVRLQRPRRHVAAGNRRAARREYRQDLQRSAQVRREFGGVVSLLGSDLFSAGGEGIGGLDLIEASNLAVGSGDVVSAYDDLMGLCNQIGQSMLGAGSMDSSELATFGAQLEYALLGCALVESHLSVLTGHEASNARRDVDQLRPWLEEAQRARR